MEKLFKQSQAESEDAIHAFLKSINSDTEKIFKEVLRQILKKVDVKKGALQNNDDLINEVRKFVMDATAKSNWNASVLQFVEQAKDVGRTDLKINKEIGNTVSSKVADRLLNNDGIFTEGLTKGGYTVNVVNRVQDILYQALYNNISVVDLTDNLEKYFMGQSVDDTGDLIKYARQTAQDAIYQYTGHLNAGISEELGLNALFYTPNILIEGSRPLCTKLIHDFNGAIPYESILPLLKKAKDEPKGFGRGVIPNTLTIADFLKDRGGYGCIHKAYPTYLKKE